ncbi:unnamed protein product [Brassicogethes aeneus]|uniref:Nose resistant-to-fluoxetine protein N-terminal domain-containing protein n=1 Tax=Brassicogethes aeneus TaxID=1431903 RepID=A0A9P0FJU9_BRAAE|nr:unnamed protein product [Brassicogethes aeneus]
MRVTIFVLLTLGAKYGDGQISQKRILDNFENAARGTLFTGENMALLKQWVIDNEMGEAADLITMQNTRQIQITNNFFFDDNINGTEVVDNGFTNRSLSERIAQKYNKTVEENECFRDVVSMFSFDNKDFPLAKMLDASAKVQPGVFYGNIQNMGNFDQCLNISGEISGKYCTIEFKPNFTSLSWSFGICIPSRCNALNLNNFIKYMVKTIKLPIAVQIEDNLCWTKEKQKQFSGLNILAMSIFVFFGLLLLCSTICDAFIPSDAKNVPLQIFLAFSLCPNAKRLFKTKMSKGNEILGCLNGIRVISMFWVLTAHAMITFLKLPSTDLIDFPIALKRWDAFIYFAAAMAMDTFLVIGGFLVVYLYLNNKNTVDFSYIALYFHRLLRLTPSLAMLVVYELLVPKLGSGPIWHFQEESANHCKTQWWGTLLYIQNYLGLEGSEMASINYYVTTNIN